MVSSTPTVDLESVADTDNSTPTDNDEDSIDASEPQSDSIVITLDDYLDEELLPVRRTPKPSVQQTSHYQFIEDPQLFTERRSHLFLM